MSNTKLEQFRHHHAVLELCKEQMHDDLVDGARGKKEQILQDSKNKQRIDKIVECTKKLIPLYDDRDKSFRNELEKIRQRGYIHEFYSRFSEIRRNHDQNVDIPVERDEISFEPNVQFSGEEWHGRFVDVHHFYEKYLNLSVFKSSSKRVIHLDVVDPITKERTVRSETGNVDYKLFLTRVFEFWRVRNDKKNKDYVKFYEELLEYLVNLWKRTHPITPIKAILKKCESVFDDEWKEQSVEGWQRPWTKATKRKYEKTVNLLNALKLKQEEKRKKEKEEKEKEKAKNDKMEADNDEDDDLQNGEQTKNEQNGGDLPMEIPNGDSQNAQNGKEEADQNGKEKDKEDDEENLDIKSSVKYNYGLYCFCCVKKFKSLGTMKGHFNSKKHRAKKAIGLLEYKVSLFADLLSDAILGAVEYIEKKQTKTYEEIRMELEDAERGEDEYDDYDRFHYDSDDMEDDPSILNPLQIPLDFDGKPIPYWLYKFRGLNRYFDCEICDQRYRGPRAFERHFREWKHAHHMRMLNIPNTKDFHMITTRKDAELLNMKIQQAKASQSWDPEREEEFEDNDGNVFKKQTYDQLRRQGVI